MCDTHPEDLVGTWLDLVCLGDVQKSAERIGVDRRTVYRWLNAETTPGAEIQQRMRGEIRDLVELPTQDRARELARRAGVSAAEILAASQGQASA